MHPLRKFKALIQELGAGTAVLYAFAWVLQKTGKSNRLFHYHLVAQPLDRRILPPRRGASIEVRELSPRDPRLKELELDDDVLAYREGQGSICFAAFKKGDIIGCLWFCLGPYEEDEVRCLFVPLPAGEAVWDYGAYIHPDHRSSLAFARLWDEASAHLRERGVRWTLSRILAFNARSLRSHSALGAQTLATATFLVLGPLQLTLCSLSPWVHLSLTQAKRPRLAVRSPACASAGEALALGEDSAA